jgi:hypothetical protein
MVCRQTIEVVKIKDSNDKHIEDNGKDRKKRL